MGVLAGIIPECSIVCYFGSLSENISQIASGKAGPSGKVTYILVGVTVFFMLAAVTWSTFVVRYTLFFVLAAVTWSIFAVSYAIFFMLAGVTWSTFPVRYAIEVYHVIYHIYNYFRYVIFACISIYIGTLPSMVCNSLVWMVSYVCALAMYAVSCWLLSPSQGLLFGGCNHLLDTT